MDLCMSTLCDAHALMSFKYILLDLLLLGPSTPYFFVFRCCFLYLQELCCFPFFFTVYYYYLFTHYFNILFSEKKYIFKNITRRKNKCAPSNKSVGSPSLLFTNLFIRARAKRT
uniref:Uncharacterized protein n=1 Tax=Lepeophtheirus salmonis TaxID=72036 RepID=A0A0K2UFJ0_LEPSM